MKTQNEQIEKTVINADNVNQFVIEYVAKCDASVKRNKWTDETLHTARYAINVNFDTIPLIDVIDRACSPVVINDQGNTRNVYSTKNNRSEYDADADDRLFNDVDGTTKTVNVSTLGKRTVMSMEQRADKTLSALTPEQLQRVLAKHGITV